MLRKFVLALLLPALPAHAAEYSFCWIGGGGYTVVGRMILPDTLANAPLITEHDVSKFKISGYLNGALIGTWDKDRRSPNASWRLHFSPREGRFLTPADLGIQSVQEWNANGFATDCGPQGFGFNAGDFAQDLCLHGEWIESSGVAPDTPFYVTYGTFDPSCRPSEALIG